MCPTPTALLVSPHAPTRDALLAALNGSGIAAVAASECDAALRCLAAVRTDIVLLDALCGDVARLRREVRALSGPVPVLYIAGRDIACAPVPLTAAAGDTVVCRPLDPSEVVALAKAAIGFALSSGDTVIRIGGLTLDPDTHTLTIGEAVLSLTPTEFRIVRCLTEGEGDAVPIATLFRRVWGAEPGAGTGDMVRAHVRNLRAKLRRATGRDGWLVTVPRRGYRFVA
jgi:two-component system OmpR family response regulator